MGEKVRMTHDTTTGSSTPLVIIGAGTYGAVIAELAEICGYLPYLFLDDDPKKSETLINGCPVSGPVTESLSALPVGTHVAAAIGDGAVRLQRLMEARSLGLVTPRLISRHAVVSPSAVVGEAVYIHANAHVWTQAHLGYGTILSPQATVAHHSTLGEGCFVSTGAHVGASISVGKSAFFGMGSTTSTGISIVEDHTVIGAGAVIIRNTVRGGVYVGSPGKLIKVRRDG